MGLRATAAVAASVVSLGGGAALGTAHAPLASKTTLPATLASASTTLMVTNSSATSVSVGASAKTNSTTVSAPVLGTAPSLSSVKPTNASCPGATNWSTVTGFKTGNPISVQGTPENLDRGDMGNTYIWHTEGDDGWTLVTTDMTNVKHTYSGTISVTGARLVLVTPLHNEADDKVTVNGDGSISYVLHTYKGLDGFHFYVTGCDGVSSSNGMMTQTLSFVTFKDGTADPMTVALGAEKGHPVSPDFSVTRTV